MKKLAVLVFVVMLASRVNGEVYAHSAGQQPNFKINGVYSDLYPVPSSNLSDFGIPQDIARDKYLINQRINFEIDLKALGVTIDQIKSTKFSWSFGDGMQGEGLYQSHIYQKKGSYILTIMVSSPELPTAQLFQSVLINIVDNKQQLMPVAKIKVNGQIVDDITKPIYADLNKSLDLEVVDSDKFDSVSWNFADGTQTIYGKKVSHKYPIDQFPGGLSIVSATVRTKTVEGYISDSYAQIYDISLKTTSTPELREDLKVMSLGTEKRGSRLIVFGLILGMIISIGIIFWKRSERRK